MEESECISAKNDEIIGLYNNLNYLKVKNAELEERLKKETEDNNAILDEVDQNLREISTQHKIQKETIEIQAAAISAQKQHIKALEARYA